ncbi:MAG: RNA methyltransferase [Ardenticatenaceae bacterium]|nr:RNA methyltransferase [Ardenticatenaceae bacterium]
MNPIRFHLRQCERPSCRFRFPVTNDRQTGELCPLCGAPTQWAADYAQWQRPLPTTTPNGPIVEALLDNIRSVYNVGSIFRTADGAGLRHLHLCGITPPPDHPKTAKTALGAELAVPWSQYRNGLDTAVTLQKQGCQLWAVEDSLQAAPLFAVPEVPDGTPVVLVVGNELAGIDPEILARCDRILRIPMQGQKKSLNVATAFGIAAYAIRFNLSTNGLGKNI